MATIQLLDYLKPTSALFLSATTRVEVLDTAVCHVAELGLVSDGDAFRDAIIARDRLLSTGIRQSVAVPRARMWGISEFFVIPVVLQHPVDWDAIDRAPVQLVFLIGGPDDNQTRYLQTLAKIVLVTKNPELRSRLTVSKRPEDIAAVFEGM